MLSYIAFSCVDVLKGKYFLFVCFMYVFIGFFFRGL